MRVEGGSEKAIVKLITQCPVPNIKNYMYRNFFIYFISFPLTVSPHDRCRRRRRHT